MQLNVGDAFFMYYTIHHLKPIIIMKYTVVCLLTLMVAILSCGDPCYNPLYDTNCPADPLRPDIDAYTFHMTVHPHLDAYWIFTFDDYYNPNPHNSGVRGYFAQNNFNSVK